MAVKTRLKNDETNGLKDVDDLDAAYVEDLKNAGLDEDLLAQFLDISKELQETKRENK